MKMRRPLSKSFTAQSKSVAQFRAPLVLQLHLDDLGDNVPFTRFQIGALALEARGGARLDAVDMLQRAA